MTAVSLAALVRRLRELDDAAWQRIADRVPSLAGESAPALVARGRVIAEGLPAGIPEVARQLLGMAHAVTVEFPERAGRVPTPTQVAALQLTPEQEATASLAATAATLLEARRAAFPGAVASIEAVLPALLAPQLLARDRLEALYAPVEPEIPLASLTEDS